MLVLMRSPKFTATEAEIQEAVFTVWRKQYEQLRALALSLDSKWAELSPLLLNKSKLTLKEISKLDRDSKVLSGQMKSYCESAQKLLRQPGPEDVIVLLNGKRNEYVRKMRNVFGIRV